VRRRLVVVGPTQAEAVRFAGGWLFDRALARWDVRVLTTGRIDPRPLQILGARPMDVLSERVSPERGPWPQAIAIWAELYDSDDRARQLMQEAMENGVEHCMLWADTLPLDSRRQAVVERYRLSAAARAFKAQAVAAISAPAGENDGTETLQHI